MALYRTYSLSWSGLTSLTTVPFAQLACPSTVGIRILRIELYQQTSEVSQQEFLSFTRRSTASTMAAGVVPVALNQGDPVSLLTGGSTSVCGTGIATGTGSLTDTPLSWSFNVLNGLCVVFTPDDAPTVSKSGFCTLQFPTSPAANTWNGQICFCEAPNL